MTHWFTADWHLGHENVLKYQPNRKYHSIEEMNLHIIGEYREKVDRGDTVWILGDLTLHPDPDYMLGILYDLPGMIRVVRGNHDQWAKRTEENHQSGRIMIYDDRIIETRVNGQRLVLSHYPMEGWPGKRYTGPRHSGESVLPDLEGAWHLHGHSHGRSVQRPLRLDVGWDTADRLLSWEDVKFTIETEYSYAV